MDANDVPVEPLVLSIGLILALWSRRVGFSAATRPEREPHALLCPFFTFVSIRVHSRLNSLSASICVHLRLVCSAHARTSANAGSI